MSLPAAFIEEMKQLLGEEANELITALEKPPVVSVRLNPRKPGASFPEATPVKWCPGGLYLPRRPAFTLDPLLHAGAYYVQDASSMIYKETVSRVLRLLGNPDFVTLLDLCAAPGGKTTAMIDALPDGSRVVANEYVAKRATILRENLSRWGYPDVVATNRDSAAFVVDGSLFDIVAVDAPCSGEGMMRKDETARTQWSPQLVKDCARLQREILSNAAKVVRPGGFLIYSTCTFNRYENEENVRFAVEQLGFKPIDLDFPQEWGIPRGTDTTYPSYRFMPHRTEGEGLFLAVMQRPENGNDSTRELPNKRESLKNVRVHPRKQISIRENRKTKSEEVPEIDDILSVDFDRSRFPIIELTNDQAISYLRREALVLPEGSPRGIVIVSYKGLPLGAAKNIGTRANNLYPKNRRILK